MKKKINSNGFAIAGLLYSLLIIFLALIFSFLLMLNNRKTILNQIKKDVYNNLSGITSDEISIDLDDLPSILVEGSDYKLPSNVSNTLKDNSNISCKVDNNEITNVSTLHSGYYNVECQITVGNKNDIVQKEILIISKGTSVYFNPETKKICNQSDAVSTTGTKTGCMKWYIYSDNNNKTFNMILDHNTTAFMAYNSTGSNAEIKEAAQQLITDTNTWDKSLNSRLITANEVAKITENTSFDEKTSEWAKWFYLDSNNQTQVANSTNKSKYAWLYDYTDGCKEYGCNIEDSSNWGYWTSTLTAGGGNSAWHVYRYGYLKSNQTSYSHHGIRPVVIVNKDLFYKPKTKSEYEISANNLLKSIQNKITSQTQEGIYYFDESGNLDYNLNNIKIELNDQGIDKTKGNVSIYNNNVIYACFNYGKYNFEYNYNTKKLNSINHKCSTVRGENLIVNSDLSSGDNTNFSNFTYKDSQLIVSGQKDVTTDFYIPIDSNKKYELGVEMKSSNTTATYYAGFREYDFNKTYIYSSDVMYLDNTLTELAKDLNNGDTVVYLKDLSKWSTSTSTRGYQRGLIFWGYKDGTGYEYGPLTYSKNNYNSLWEDANVDKTNNTITLNKAWSKGTFKAGTQVSQSNAGSDFNYSVLLNKTVGTNWNTYKSSAISGRGQNNTTFTKFRYGTRFIRMSFLINYNKTADTTTNIKNIYFREVIS